MAKSKKPTAKLVQVDTHKHVADKRRNIPTRETAAFAKENGGQPFVIHRDRSLDPQLVWKGKDEQDAQPLEVPAVPLHVQEKIHPQAIVEDVKAWAQRDKPVADLFSDFNGLDDFAKKLEFYQHDQHWTNRLILGDSLLVMASLAEKERLRGKVQCVYFDPPYGIKFGSNWQVSTRKRDVKDAKAEDLTRQPEQIKAFRDTWELGIHSYLSYLRDRLAAARDLLTESGSIFVQIGDENVHLVRGLLDEVFGSENYCGLIAFRTTTGKAGALVDTTCDYLVWYAKDLQRVKFRRLYFGRSASEDANFRYVLSPNGKSEPLGDRDPDNLAKGLRLFRYNPLTSQSGSETTIFPYKFEGKTFKPKKGGWKTNLEGMQKLDAASRLLSAGETLCFLRFFNDFPFQQFNNIWDDTRQSGFTDSQDLCSSNKHNSHRALPADDHRPRRPRAGSHLRQRHDGVCRRAVGPALDHHGHVARRPGAGAHAAHGRPLPVLLARRFRRGPQEADGADRHTD